MSPRSVFSATRALGSPLSSRQSLGLNSQGPWTHARGIVSHPAYRTFAADDFFSRCPMHCRLSQSSEPWKCTISLNFLSSRSTTSKKAVTVPFGEVITDRSRVEERIRRAQRAVLSPNTDHTFFLDKPEEECPPAELTFTSDYVQIEISDHNLTNLSFFDLPGVSFHFTPVL